MLLPPFELPSLNPRLAQGDGGKSFPRLVYEVLKPDRPGLLLVDAPGKDGGVDLSETRHDGRTVIECKYIAEDGPASAARRWGEVAARLRLHLASAGGPTKGQAQYGPWYRRDPRIVEYVFCVSSTIGNQENLDALQCKISAFFAQLAAQHGHLAHLQRLHVEVFDWAALRLRIERRLHVAYRWFPTTRPVGVVPFDEPLRRGTFRGYLESAQLPYFSIESYRVGRETVLRPETELLVALDQEPGGLVISGRGGVGKTRLTLELGHLAQKADWTVVRVLPSFDRSALLELAERATQDERILLLFDYVELHQEFEELADLVPDLNETYGLHIRYVANCRGTHYRRLSPITGHMRVEIAPAAGMASADYTEYAKETIRHILVHGNVPISDEAFLACRNTPVLAVFLAYLAASKRDAELTDLLKERDFGSWVAKRVQMSFHEPVHRDMAVLVALLPVPVSSVKEIGPVRMRLLDVLVADGWSERDRITSDRDEFVMAHDVLADQILLSYVREIAGTLETFVRDLLATAAAAHCVNSVLIALQRVAAEPPLAEVDWLGAIDEEAAANPAPWLASVRLLLTTKLLNPEDRVELLHRHGERWRGAEADADVQRAIGWLASWAVRREQAGGIVSRRSTLETWAIAAASGATTSSYAIPRALRLTPDGARDAAVRWMAEHPLDVYTSQVLVAWLDVGLPTADLKAFVNRWAQESLTSERFSFLASQWLNGGGDREFLLKPIQRWVSEHASRRYGSFVYKAWLDAGGDRELVREPIQRWLSEHATRPDADFVYKAWLDAGGDRELVREPIQRWLSEHATRPDADFVCNAWLEAGGERELVRETMQRWLSEHATLPEARFVYTSWLGAQGEHELVEESIDPWLSEHATQPEAQFVYRAWLDAGGERELVREPIQRWLSEHATLPEADFVCNAWLEAGGERELVRETMQRWLSEHASRPDASFFYQAWLEFRGDRELVREPIQRWLSEHATQPEAQFVYRAWLDAGGERELVREPIQRWLSEHATLSEADFVYTAWLDADGEREIVRQPLRRWLSRHASRPDASFLYQAWLESRGDRELVREPIQRWLSEHAMLAKAAFVYKAWLGAKGEIEVVRQPIRRWLSEHATSPAADFVYKAWLDAGGDIELVRQPIEGWLSEHASRPDAWFLYQAWLNARGEREVVQPSIHRWLSAHGMLPEARFVYCAWLDAGGSIEHISDHALAWFHANCNREHAMLVLDHILRQRHLSLQTVQDALEWCASFPSNRDTLRRLTALGPYLLRVGVGEQFLKAASAVIIAVSPRPSFRTRARIATLIYFLVASSELAAPTYREKVDNLIVAWLHRSCADGQYSRARPIPGARSKERGAGIYTMVDIIGEADFDDVTQQVIRRFIEWFERREAARAMDPERLLVQLRAQATLREAPADR